MRELKIKIPVQRMNKPWTTIVNSLLGRVTVNLFSFSFALFSFCHFEQKIVYLLFLEGP